MVRIEQPVKKKQGVLGSLFCCGSKPKVEAQPTRRRSLSAMSTEEAAMLQLEAMAKAQGKAGDGGRRASCGVGKTTSIGFFSNHVRPRPSPRALRHTNACCRAPWKKLSRLAMCVAARRAGSRRATCWG